ncbi:hypothetical protein I6Y99_005034 [Vibrio parahaemolyticus]|uniref:hypothetical protein n=1 Tax=Vibrio parahaemolyticus TaxID=670 RepID=UPI001A2F3394|nr:hypothetical protein [Vibrio parahaemolyticus]EGQ7796229.1 hypothetical protein [Vibrio parahaemolyticus]EGQ7810964.1 hypothetical protein [Vibrio parahaemolyticus]EJB8691649.1 hypothetical protein [Vibrio parahaemolyticus]MCZ5880368.1 hypothetical protein [Vibrio parahaemolyticus]MCZ6298920.1 hypothetical protein [Vibrio parahaemolyticus]
MGVGKLGSIVSEVTLGLQIHNNDVVFEDRVMLTPSTGDAVYGDKVMRDKYVNIVTSDVSLDLVKPVLLDVVHKLGEGEKDEAIISLNTLSMLGSLNSSTKVAIACLKAVSSLELSEEEEKLIINNYQSNTTTDEDFRDFLNAAAINLLKKQTSEKELKDFYCSLPANTCSDIAYYSTLDQVASLDDISRDLGSFSLPVLYLLLEKAFASGKVEVCQKIFDELKSKAIFADLTGQEVILACISINDFNINDYLLLSTEQKEYLDSVIDRLIEFSNSQQILDKNYVGIGAQLLHFTQISNTKLLKFIKERRSILNKIEFTGKDAILKFLESEGAESSTKTQQSPHDIAIEIIDNVKVGVFSSSKILALCESRNSEQVEYTLNELLKLDRTTECLVSFCALAAKAADFLDTKQFPLFEIDSIFTKDFKETRLHSDFLLPVANLLSMAGQSALALRVLDLLFKNVTPWISDTYVQYLSFLYENEQYNSLNARLSAMSSKEHEHPEIKNLKSCLAANESKFPEAVKLIEEQLEKYQDKELSESEKKYCIYLWLNLMINLSRFLSAGDLAEHAKRIPISIFSTPDDECAWELLTFIGERYVEVEDMVLRWFFKNPSKYANNLFKIVTHIPANETVLGYNSHTFKKGYRYTENRQEKYRLTVDDQTLATEHPQYLIHPDSALASTLEGKKENDYFLYKTKHCSIKEIILPTVAAYRIAIEILDNDENAIFSLLSLPENPTAEDILNVINSILGSAEKYTPAMEECLRTNFPCVFKYNHMKGINSYAKALTAMLSKNVYMELFGESNVSFDAIDHKDVVLDEVSFAFLVVSGLSCKVGGNLHVTSETLKKIKEWCSFYEEEDVAFDVQKDEFIAVGAKDKFQQKLKLREVTEELLAKCIIHHERNYDIPLRLAMLTRGLLTSSSKSSLGLAVTNGFSYFTVENQLRALLSRPEFITVNVAPADVKNFIFKDSTPETIGHALLLQLHNFNLQLPWEAFDKVCVYGSEESLHNLDIFMSSISVNDHEMLKIGIVNIIKSIIVRSLSGKSLQASRNVLETLFIKYFEFNNEFSLVATDFLNMLPSVVVHPCENDLLKNQSYQTVGKATKKTTNIYIDAFSNAVKKSPNASNKIWNMISSLC